MKSKKQIWVNEDTKENLIKIARRENKTITKVMDDLCKRGMKRYE